MGHVTSALLRTSCPRTSTKCGWKRTSALRWKVDSQKMPGRIVTAREAVAERLKDLEGNSDHHAERHEMQSALAALVRLEGETRIWPTAAICTLEDDSTA